MGRPGSTTHQWTEAELVLLENAVKEASSMLPHYQRQGYTETDWWSCVAGVLFKQGGPVVTGKACARQYELLMERTKQDDAWDEVARKVDEYECGLAESIEQRLVALEKGTKEMLQCLHTVLKELGVALPGKDSAIDRAAMLPMKHCSCGHPFPEDKSKSGENYACPECGRRFKLVHRPGLLCSPEGDE